MARSAFGHRRGGLRTRSSHSTDRITNASQVEQVAYRYRAFGEQTLVSGSSPKRFTWVGRLGHYPYAHSGRDGSRRPSHCQPDSGDYWVWARVYRPHVGRWASRDPTQQELNLYRCAGNRSVVMVDPSGVQAIGCCEVLYRRTETQYNWGPWRYTEARWQFSSAAWTQGVSPTPGRGLLGLIGGLLGWSVSPPVPEMLCFWAGKRRREGQKVVREHIWEIRVERWNACPPTISFRDRYGWPTTKPVEQEDEEPTTTSFTWPAEEPQDIMRQLRLVLGYPK